MTLQPPPRDLTQGFIHGHHICPARSDMGTDSSCQSECLKTWRSLSATLFLNSGSQVSACTHPLTVMTHPQYTQIYEVMNTHHIITFATSHSPLMHSQQRVQPVAVLEQDEAHAPPPARIITCTALCA